MIAFIQYNEQSIIYNQLFTHTHKITYCNGCSHIKSQRNEIDLQLNIRSGNISYFKMVFFYLWR